MLGVDIEDDKLSYNYYIVLVLCWFFWGGKFYIFVEKGKKNVVDFKIC